MLDGSIERNVEHGGNRGEDDSKVRRTSVGNRRAAIGLLRSGGVNDMSGTHDKRG